MKKILIALPLVAVLSACMTTQNNASDPTISDPAPTFNNTWTSNLVDHKAELRSCLFSNKDIESVIYMDNQPTTTIFTVKTKNGAVLDCSVNNKTRQVSNISPRTENIPRNVHHFYSVDKRVPDACKGKELVRDAEKRIMGTICY